MAGPNLPNVAVILARCRRYRHGYGIRIEEYDRGTWIGDWAFAVRDDVARRERYDNSVIEGHFSFSDSYPGCPHCGDTFAFLCGCGRSACWDDQTRIVTCPWCGVRGEVAGHVTRIAIDGDR